MSGDEIVRVELAEARALLDVGDFYVSCHKCGARFKRSELQGALISFSGLAAESDDICPVCGEWHCIGGNGG